jgi:hypothetical protein
VEAIFPIVLAVSQWLLGQSVTGCPVEGITESQRDGSTYVGAIAECSEQTFGLTFKADGSIVIEDRR